MAERLKHLKVLGLSSGASEDEIKKAYKKLALQVHPDKNDSHDANEKFQELSQAYTYLIKGTTTNLQDNNEDARAEFFRRMFAEMFMPPPFFFSAHGGFPFFCDPFEDDDDDYYDDGYFYSSDSSDGWRPNFQPEFDRREGDQYKFSHANASHGPEMSNKQLRKKEKRRRQRARQRERKEKNLDGTKPAQTPGSAQKKPSPQHGHRYSDDINNSEANKENKDRNWPNFNIGGLKQQTEYNKPKPTTAGPQSTESKVNTEKTQRSSTPVRQDQQKSTKNLKKKMESEQRKREKEAKEIAAELLRQQEEKREKQRRKEEQEREQRENEKKQQSYFEPFHEFNPPESKSKKQKKRERKREEESARSSPDQCPLPTEKKHSFEEPEFGQPKVSPFGPIGSKIPQTGSGTSDNAERLPKTASSSSAKLDEGHRQWYNPYHDEKPTPTSRQPNQSQPKYINTNKPQQKSSGKHKDSSSNPSSHYGRHVPFTQRNQFEILDNLSDEEESSEEIYESDSDGQPCGFMGAANQPFHPSTYSAQSTSHIHSTTNSGNNNIRPPGSYHDINRPGGYPNKTTKQQLPHHQATQFSSQTHKFASDSISMDRNTRNQNGYDALDDFDIVNSGRYGNNIPAGTASNSGGYGNSSTAGTSNKQQQHNVPSNNFPKTEKPAESAHHHFGQNRSATGFSGNPGRGRGGLGHPPPPRNVRPMYGGRQTAPMNGYGPGPRYPGPRPGPRPRPQAQHNYNPMQSGYNQYPGQFNAYNRPPGFATRNATPRPQAFTGQGSYHDIGRNGTGNYDNQTGDLGNHSAQNVYGYGGLGNQNSFGNRKPGDDLNVNGFREGQRRDVNNRSNLINNNNKFGTNAPSFVQQQQHPDKTVPSVNKSEMKHSVNSYDSLDSLDDFPIQSEKAKSSNLVNENDFDLSNMSVRFEGILGKEELNVPGGMFSDNIKNYYN